jgi:integrase/recombinase XerD
VAPSFVGYIEGEVGKSLEALSAEDISLYRELLGHADPKTTLRYIRRAEELATRAYQYNTLPI